MKNPTSHLNPPGNVVETQDQAASIGRAYFAAHPTALTFVWRRLAGEFDALDGDTRSVSPIFIARAAHSR